MTTNQPPLSAFDQELEALGNALIKPTSVPPDWPADFFHSRMNFGSTTGLTNGAKNRQFRHRVLYSSLRSSAYEKVLAACLARTRVARTVAFLFALVWGGGMLALNWSKVGELKASLASVAAVIPGLGGLAGQTGAQMTPEQMQLQELRRQLGQ